MNFLYDKDTLEPHNFLKQGESKHSHISSSRTEQCSRLHSCQVNSLHVLGCVGRLTSSVFFLPLPLR